MRCAWLVGVCVCVGVLACGDDGGSGAKDDAGTSVLPPVDGTSGSGSVGGLPGDCTPVDTTYAAFAQGFFATSCAPCHLESSTGDARLGAPPEVSFGAEDDVAFWQARIRVRALDERTMPPGAPLSGCDAAHLESYLDALGGAGACQAECSGKDCGPDGCGGSCGQCELGQACAASGACVDASCQSTCEGIACGDDGCGGSCGACGPGFGCSTDGSCVCAPRCDGKSCGDDGCGGSCGSCSSDEVCTIDGQCLCIPECDGLVCGDDGCGGVCGTCRRADLCADDQTSCETCVPDCDGKACGDDGCGGFCPNNCSGAMQYCDNASNTCKTGICRDKCGTRECGYVGCAVCGSDGGECPGAEDVCDAEGQCACAPDCVGQACGDDGCGGDCGTCPDGLTCDGEQCGCTADCSGRECGSDGCGASCGPDDGSCADGLTCNAAGQCAEACVPDCGGKTCGGDGCGGTCGGCGAGETCDGSSCVAGSVSFADVFAIFEQKSCARAGCHTGVNAPEGLVLSSEQAAQSDLVDVSSGQCSGKKLVLPGDSAQSYLVNKLTGSGMCSGSQMPKGSTPLNNAQLDTVRAWIDGL